MERRGEGEPPPGLLIPASYRHNLRLKRVWRKGQNPAPLSPRLLISRKTGVDNQVRALSTRGGTPASAVLAGLQRERPDFSGRSAKTAKAPQMRVFLQAP
jgi:hypothetical protein